MWRLGRRRAAEGRSPRQSLRRGPRRKRVDSGGELGRVHIQCDDFGGVESLLSRGVVDFTKQAAIGDGSNGLGLGNGVVAPLRDQYRCEDRKESGKGKYPPSRPDYSSQTFRSHIRTRFPQSPQSGSSRCILTRNKRTGFLAVRIQRTPPTDQIGRDLLTDGGGTTARRRQLTPLTSRVVPRWR